MADFIPTIHRATLPGGLTLLGVEYDRVPWVSLTFMAKRGAETDPSGKPGVCDWTAELMTLGTARRDQLQLAEDIESRGASLQGRGGWDATLISLEGLAEDFPEHLATLAEVVQSPGFPEDDFAHLKERRRAELVHQLDDPREIASLRYQRLFFGEAPYGHPVPGDIRHLDDLTLDDLREFYRREFTPETATIVVVGMVGFQRVQEEVSRLWSAWQGGGLPSPPYQGVPEGLAAPGIYLLNRPDLTQSEIRMGHLGLPRSHPDYFPLKLVNYILGEGGFASRLMARIRSDLGFTYGIRSNFSFRRAPGPFTVSTFTPAANTAQVVAEISQVIGEVHRGGVTDQELAEAQSYFIGHFPLGLETSRGIARQLLTIDLHDLGIDYLKRYCDQIRQVTSKTAAAAALEHLEPQNLVTLVMGPAAQCLDSLQQLGPVKILEEI
jgi:zinc protease